jgi:4-alpha-glucanotransferase
VGAPPDGFSPEGQDWSFPPPNAEAHRADGYRLFSASIRQNARHGGALRIDHVMRLFRLYWIPEGHTPRDGAYVSAPWKDLLGVLALESHRLKIRVIGEDLGTITGEMRAALTSYGLLGYKVLYFERNWDGTFRSPGEYSSQAVATVTTHDLPTLAGFWAGRDISARRDAGLLTDPQAFEAQVADRAGARRALAAKLVELGLLTPDEAAALLAQGGGDLRLLNGVLGLLASTPCELLSINQEDVSLEPEQQNLPGSTWQHPNWRRKGKFSLEDLASGEPARAEVELLRTWLRRSGRVRA